MRILHIVSGDRWAGAEVVAYNLIRGTAGFCDVSIRVIALNDGVLSESIRKAGVEVIIADESRHSFVQLARLIRKEVQGWNPSIVHSHRYKENLLSLFAAGLRRKCALLVTQHGLPERRLGMLDLVGHLKRIVNALSLARGFDGVVAVSEDIGRSLRQSSFGSSDRVHVIRNGVMLPDRCPRREDGKDFVIGSAGRLVPVKDYGLLMEVARIVCRESSRVRFEIAGDGPMMDELRGRAAALGLGERILFRGFVDDVPLFLEGLHLYINTSLHEGIPMSVLEAMSLGVPVVVPDIGGLPEIVKNGDSGFLVGGRDPESFARVCLLLCADAALRAKLGSGAYSRVKEEFSIDRMCRRYYEVYRYLSHDLERGSAT